MRKGYVRVLSRIKIFVLCSIACFIFGITGCEKGIAEKTGQKIDKAVDSAEETAHDAAK